jgi:hypothetical protein
MTEVGGYFALELPPARPARHARAHRYQSARACLAALLEARPARRVWAPKYICDSMLAPLTERGIALELYGIDREFRVESRVTPGDGDVVLYVNYFGLCAAGEQAAIERFGAGRVILDRSQAFFAAPRECLAAIYSPRKFFGVPDGGLLETAVSPRAGAPRDRGSVQRCAHLLLRHDGPATEGYAAFRAAEATLDDCTPRAMSGLTARILDSIDTDEACRRRDENFAWLHSALGHANRLDWSRRPDRGPLCYPFLAPREGIREALIAAGVYVPTYWPEVAARTSEGDFEHELLRKVIPLPCDQRYAPGDLAGIVRILHDALEPASATHPGTTK